jgi:AraC-like DNA-binding protein
LSARGYGNASHFTREYKRLFGEPPMRDVELLRKVAGNVWWAKEWRRGRTKGKLCSLLTLPILLFRPHERSSNGIIDVLVHE